MTAVEDVASVEVAAQTAVSDDATHEAVGGGGRKRPLDGQEAGLCTRDCAVRSWGMSHQTEEAARVAALLLLRATPRGVLTSGCREASAAQSRSSGASPLL